MKKIKKDLNVKNDDIPIGIVTIKYYMRARLWVLAKCPICGSRHIHGAGGIGEGNPAEFLGHRVPHCQNFFFRSLGYNLVWDPEDERHYLRKIYKRTKKS